MVQEIENEQAGKDTGEADLALDNANQRLMLDAFAEQASVLLAVFEEETNKTPETEPKLAALMALRDSYRLWKDDPGSPQLTDFFESLSEHLRGQSTENQ